MNRISAEKKLMKLREKCLGYCPLIKDDCNKDCVSYSEGSVSKLPFPKPDEEESWCVYPPNCISPIINRSRKLIGR